MVGNLNTSDERFLWLLQCFNSTFHFKLAVSFRTKYFLKMGSLTKILTLPPIPNPAHNSRERMMKVSHSRTTNWRFSSWWGILVLIKINGGSPIWSMIYSGEWSQFKAIGSLKNRLLHPYHHLIFVFHSENSLKKCFINNIYIFIFYNLYFQLKSVGDLLTSNFLLPIILQGCQVLPCLCLLALMDLIFSQIKN